MPPKPDESPGPQPAGADAGPIQLENTVKRDYLKSLEAKYQKEWQESKIFETDSPMTTEKDLEALSPEEIRERFPKWLGTFPYPYMNGSLHLGHAFSLSKVDFLGGYQRMLGKRALFPLGFHATGMPIRSSADKLIREVEMFGSDFSKYKEEDEEEKPAVDTDASTSSVAQGNVGKATKGKLQAKSTGLKYQFQILESIGVPREEIHKFTDGRHWLDYFPPIAKVSGATVGCSSVRASRLNATLTRPTARPWGPASTGDAPFSPPTSTRTTIRLYGGR